MMGGVSLDLPPTIRPGLLSRADADALNAALRQLYGLSRLTAAAPLESRQDETGTRLALHEQPAFWARVGTGAAGAYAWTQVRQDRDTGFSWDTEGLSDDLSDPAYEASGNTAVPSGSVVWLRKELSQWVFEYPASSAGGSTGGTVSYANTTVNYTTDVVSYDSTTTVTYNQTVLVWNAVTWNVTGDTTCTISAGVSLFFVGLNATTSVIDVTSLSFKFEASAKVYFSGCAVFITANDTWTVSSSTTWSLLGLNATTSVVDITSLTWKYESSANLYFAGCSVYVTSATTWTISSGTTWSLVGLNATTSIIDVSSLTWKFESTSTLVMAGLTWNVTADTTCTLSAGVRLTFTGGLGITVCGGDFTICPTSTFIIQTSTIQIPNGGTIIVPAGKTVVIDGGGNLQIDIPVVNVDNSAIWVFDTSTNVTFNGTVTFPGTVAFTGVVTGAGGLISSSATHLTGTTGDSYATIISLSDPQGVHGSFGVKNTGGSNNLDVLVTFTDLFGVTGLPSSISLIGPTHVAHRVIDEMGTGDCQSPFGTVLLQIRSSTAGSPTTYEAWVSTTAAATLSVGNGGTGSDLSGTGGLGQVVTQPTHGGGFQVGSLGVQHMPGPSRGMIARGYR